jgi:D-alanyl-D-alanine dipeptidase
VKKIIPLLYLFIHWAHAQEHIHFTYLDQVDNSILFSSSFYHNQFRINDDETYCIFTDTPRLPGYEGQRCIIDLEIALALRDIQIKLKETGPYSLKVLDAYRPQQTVDFLCTWVQLPEDPIIKQYFHPAVSKLDFHKLSYLAQKSSHSRGVAVDLTIVATSPEKQDFTSSLRPEGFLGIYDPQELDMGNVGFLAFDARSAHLCQDLTLKQAENRKKLLSLMHNHQFRKLRSEFWHYFYKMERNEDYYFNFPIRDDYLIRESGELMIPKV